MIFFKKDEIINHEKKKLFDQRFPRHLYFDVFAYYPA